MGERARRGSPFVFDWVLEHAAASPEAPALGTPAGGWLTYRALAERVGALAASFVERGVGRGDRVLLALPHVPAAVVAALAAKALGALPVEVNREWGSAALAEVLRQTQARHVVLSGTSVGALGGLLRAQPLAHAWVVHPAPPPERMLAALGPCPATHLREDGALPAAAGHLEPARFVREREAPALIVYTSGSTGTPRGVVQTHRNLDANTRSIVDYLGLSAADRALLILPLFYCYGRSVLRTHLHVGGSVFLDGRFLYPRVVMEALATEACTGFAGVPLTFELLRRSVPLEEVPRPRLRYVTQAGGPMTPEMVAWARAAFAPASLYVMYGQTEATARLSYLPPETGEAKRGSIGIPIPGVEMRVVDEGGAPLGPGEVGHLVARGDNVTPGYWQAPAESAEVLREGWLWTGDLGWRDADGYFFLTGRAREMLKLGGHRVSAVELEQLALSHPEVQEAAVVGVRRGDAELAHAFVVRRPGSALTPEALRRFCRARVPAFKVPGVVSFVEALPRSAAGKVLKSELAARPLPAEAAS